MVNNGLNSIEAFFKLPFNEVIDKLHWEQKLSIKKLSSLCGISRDTFQRQAKNHNLKLRNIKEATALTANKGEKHWAFGIKRPDCSIRMKEKNPSFNNNNLIKAAKRKSLYFKDNLLPQEIIFSNILDKHNVIYETQYPINRYIIDFFIPAINLCIEIDSTSKWGKTRRSNAFIKDTLLNKLGFNVLRINKLKLTDILFITNILQTNNVISYK